jgi:hypothetical protein
MSTIPLAPRSARWDTTAVDTHISSASTGLNEMIQASVLGMMGMKEVVLRFTDTSTSDPQVRITKRLGTLRSINDKSIPIDKSAIDRAERRLAKLYEQPGSAAWPQPVITSAYDYGIQVCWTFADREVLYLEPRVSFAALSGFVQPKLVSGGSTRRIKSQDGAIVSELKSALG